MLISARSFIGSIVFLLAMNSVALAEDGERPVELIWGANFENQADISRIFRTGQKADLDKMGKGALRLEPNPGRKRKPRVGDFRLIGNMLDHGALFSGVPQSANMVLIYRSNEPVQKLRVSIQTTKNPVDAFNADIESVPETKSWKYLYFKMATFKRITRKKYDGTFSCVKLSFFAQPQFRGSKLEFDIHGILLVRNLPEKDVARKLEKMISNIKLQSGDPDFHQYYLSPEIVYHLRDIFKKGEREPRRILVVGGKYAANNKFLDPLRKSILKKYSIDHRSATKAKSKLSKMRTAMNRAIRDKRPEFVILIPGHEFADQDSWKSDFQSNYPGMIEDIVRSGSIPILATIPGDVSNNKYTKDKERVREMNVLIRSLARKNRLPYLAVERVLFPYGRLDAKAGMMRGEMPSDAATEIINEAAGNLILRLERFVVGRPNTIPGEPDHPETFIDDGGIQVGETDDLDNM